MDNRKNDHYYINKIITDLRFILAHTRGCSQAQLCTDEVLLDSVMFRLIQISENAGKLTESFRSAHPSIPFRAMKGLRNRIVHEYGNVDLSVIYDTVHDDIPELLAALDPIAAQCL